VERKSGETIKKTIIATRYVTLNDQMVKLETAQLSRSFYSFLTSRQDEDNERWASFSVAKSVYHLYLPPACALGASRNKPETIDI